MTASPGWLPRAVRAAARSATSARIFLARALPSMSWAVMSSSSGLRDRNAKGRSWRPFAWERLSGLGLRAEGDLQQIGHGVGVQLFHDVGAVRLHRLDADAQV